MADVLTWEEFALPEGGIHGTGLESFWRYLEWERGSKRIGSRVRDRFQPALFELTGYTDDWLPPEEVGSYVPVGENRFCILSKPTTKKPAYGEVVVDFRRYLEFLKQQRTEEQALREGVWMIDGEVYAHLNVLEETIERSVQDRKSGREGVSQELVGLLGPEGLVKAGKGKAPARFRLSFDLDYSQVTPQTAGLFWDAVNFLARWGEAAGEFKEEVKGESLRTLGGPPAKPVAVRYVFDDIAFYHQLEPRTTISYKDVVDGFTKPAPEQIRSNSRVGDFPKVRMFMGSGKGLLLEKRQVDQAFLDQYAPRRRGERIFVRLEGVESRLRHHIADSSSPSLEQNFYVGRVRPPAS